MRQVLRSGAAAAEQAADQLHAFMEGEERRTAALRLATCRLPCLRTARPSASLGRLSEGSRRPYAPRSAA